MTILESLKSAYSIKKGDKLEHPVFGNIRVDGIFKKENEDGYDLFCTLLEFNGTVKVFDAMDMVRIKYRRKTRLKAIK